MSEMDDPMSLVDAEMSRLKSLVRVTERERDAATASLKAANEWADVFEKRCIAAEQRVAALETAAYTLVPMSDGSVVRVCRVCQHGTRGRGEHSDECWYGAALAAATQEAGAGEPIVTICTDLPMNPTTAAALGEMTKLVVNMMKNPRCPRCGSLNVLEPAASYPVWTCDPCGHDFTVQSAPASAPPAPRPNPWENPRDPTRCQASMDGECEWSGCPQKVEYKTICALYRPEDDDER